MQARSKKQIVLIFFLALLTTPFAIRATSLARLSVEQLAASADAVARVRSVGAESRLENGSIWTLTWFAVVETMKGTLPPQVTVRLPGGRVGHLTASVDGTPKFSPGDEAIVFLQHSPTGGYSVAGWVEGSFHIARDPRTNLESVTQDSSSFAVFDVATRTFQTVGIRHMPIEQFRARVTAAIATATMHGQEKSR